MQDYGFRGEGDRGSIIMTDQSKWLLYATPYCFAAAFSVPLDIQNSRQPEHWQASKTFGANNSHHEYPSASAQHFARNAPPAVTSNCILVRSSAESGTSPEPGVGQEFHNPLDPVFVPRGTQRTLASSIPRETGGRPRDA